MTDARLKLIFQFAIFFLLLVIDAVMFGCLLNGFRTDAISAEVAALLSAIVTAITGAIALASKDWFDAHDDVP